MSDVNDQDIFDQATAGLGGGEAPAELPGQAPPAGTDDQAPGGAPRDDRGRFAQKTADAGDPPAAPGAPAAPAAVAQPEQGQQPPPEGQSHQVPLTELLNTRERAQRAEAEAAEFRRQAEAMKRRFEEMQRPQQRPDFFENPDEYLGTFEQRIDQRMREMEANMSLRFAHRQHGKDFEEAYVSLQRAGQSGDGATVQRILTSPDPGDALMRWHKERAMVEKTGGDLEGYLKKREEELLNDPEFMKRVGEHLRTQSQQPQASGAPGGRPSTVVNLPPSLSRIPSAGPSTDGAIDMDDAAIFARATAKR